MSIETKRISIESPEKAALNLALDKLLSPETKKEVLTFFELKNQVVMGGTKPLTKDEISRVLGMFFGFGASLILDEFYNKLEELKSESELPPKIQPN